MFRVTLIDRSGRMFSETISVENAFMAQQAAEQLFDARAIRIDRLD